MLKVAVCGVFVVNKSKSVNILRFSMCTELELIKSNNDNTVNKFESEEKKLKELRQKGKSQEN